MKTEWQVKLLLCLLKRSNRASGFTLLELLVVIFILGLLSAIAMPSVLGQVNRAREAEAQTYVAAINRGQQAYFLERSEFAQLTQLELGLSSTKNYTYASAPAGTGFEAKTTAQPIGTTMRGYAGRVWLHVMNDGNVTSRSIVCYGYHGKVPDITGDTCPSPGP